MIRSPMRRKRRQPKVMVRGVDVISPEFSDAVKRAVIGRSGGRCEFPSGHAGRPVDATEFHHRLRRSQGGPGTVENCLHLCHFHHGYVHANVAESYERGWLIRQGQPVTPIAG